MKTYEARNVEEAVELAHDLKAQGLYNWFRGQVRDWPPVCSLYRLTRDPDPNVTLLAKQRRVSFVEWMVDAPELESLKSENFVNQADAIAQHYGIPTPFIDFTTDPGVAGFFAADTKNPPTEGLSCIYCLDTKDLMAMWEEINDERPGAHMELVEINVHNLWRLQAQKGIFLYCSYNWDVDYPMDRIVFPYTGYPSFPTADIIYPSHKSSLEQILDQYFDIEKNEIAGELIRRKFEMLSQQSGNTGIFHWNSYPDGFYPPAFVDEIMLPLDSWNKESLLPWHHAGAELYHETMGPSATITLKTNSSSEQTQKAVIFGVKQMLRSNSSLREKTFEWLFVNLPDWLSNTTLNDMLRPIWNGMRRLPYTDDQIAIAFGSIIKLLFSQHATAHAHPDRLGLMRDAFGDCVQVAFSNSDGSGSRGYANVKRLSAAFRPDMVELLQPEFKKFAMNINKLLPILYNPRYLFDFELFADLFAEEIIPSQVFAKRDLFIFNPAGLETFGLP
jgi:hypothetical protein